MGVNEQLRPIVSVVIPTYNGERTVVCTLLNILGQDFPRSNFEIIVVDDNSTDNTRQLLAIIAEMYAPRGFQVTLLRNQTKGASSARNKGIQASRGDIVAFTDQDVLVPKNWLNEILNAMRSPEVAGVYGYLTTDFDRFLEPLMTTSINKRYLTACCAYRKDVLLEVGMFNERFPFFREDSELAYRIMKSGHLVEEAPRLTVFHPLKKFRLKDLKDGLRLSTVDPFLFKIHPNESGEDVFRQVLPRLTAEGSAFVFFVASLAILSAFVNLNYVLLTSGLMIVAAVFLLAVIRTSYKGKPPSSRLAGATVSLVLFFLTVVGRIFGSLKYRTLLI